MAQQLPAYLANRNVAANGFSLSDYTSGIGSALPAHLSIEGNAFTLIDDAGNERRVGTLDRDSNLVFDICIIAANDKISRMYFDPSKPYNRDDNVPPLCWSDNGQGPSRNAMEPQSNLCGTCPMSAWNSSVSRVTGRGVPACQSSKKLAFIVPGDADEIVYMLKVPPASMSNLATYVKTLAGHNLGGRPAQPSDVITRLSFESQGILAFAPAGIVDEDTFNRTEAAYGDPARLTLVTGRDDIPIDPAQPLRNQAVAGAAPQRQLPPQGHTPPPPQRQQATPQQPGLGQYQQELPPTGQGGQPTPPANRAPRKPRGAAAASQQAPQATGAAPNVGGAGTATTGGAQAGAQTTGDGLDIPQFLRRTAEPAQPDQQQQFGVVTEAAPPPNEILAGLDAAFSLPTS